MDKDNEPNAADDYGNPVKLDITGGKKMDGEERDGKCHLHDDCIHQEVCNYWMELRRDEMMLRMKMVGCGFYSSREK